MSLDALAGPPLSDEVRAGVRLAYGLLMTLTVLQLGPVGRWFLTTATHGGYLDPGPWRDRLLGPVGRRLLWVLWLASSCSLTLDLLTPLAGTFNFVCCYYFFIATRWTGILRGMGAPGFMSCWLGAIVLLFEIGRHADPTGELVLATTLAARVDFAVIMLCAGTYKAFAGYRSNDGMELGMVNPWWGYGWLWPRVQRTRPTLVLFRVFNSMAWLVQISAGLLMLVPSLRWVGASLIAISFAGIALQIRLGFLCEMVILSALLCAGDGTPLGQLVALASPPVTPPTTVVPLPHWVPTALTWAALVYVAALPLAKLGLYLNFYAVRRLPGALQPLLERYTNLTGLIVWRVFTVDVVGFFVDIDVVGPDGRASPYARPGHLEASKGFRYLHVGEFVCLASLFTALKYHTSNTQHFESRLVRYARTVPCPPGSRVRFLYRLIRKHPDRFEHEPVVEFLVDPLTGAVQERALDPTVSIRAPADRSPVHEGARPGTYAPAAAPNLT